MEMELDFKFAGQFENGMSTSNFDYPYSWHCLNPPSSQVSSFCDSSVSNGSGCYLQSPGYEDTPWKFLSSLERLESTPQLLNRSHSFAHRRLPAKRLTRQLKSFPYCPNFSNSDELYQPKSSYSCTYSSTEVGLDTSSSTPTFCSDDIFTEQSEMNGNDTPLSSESYNDFSGLIEFMFEDSNIWECNFFKSEQSFGAEGAKVSPQSSESVQTGRQLDDSQNTVDDWSLLYVYHHLQAGKTSSQSRFRVASPDSFGGFCTTEPPKHELFIKVSNSPRPALIDDKKNQTDKESSGSRKNRTSSSNSISRSKWGIGSQKIRRDSDLHLFAKLASFSQGGNSKYIIELLLGSAKSAIHSENLELATVILVRLKELISKTGDTLQRVAAYFVEGIECVLSGEPQMNVLTREPLHDFIDAFESFQETSPYLKFGYLAANQAIIEAIEGETSLHIVDYDIMEGVQWPSLMQALANRKGGAPHLKITALSRHKREPHIVSFTEVGEKLADYAAKLDLPFSFHQVHLNNEVDIPRIVVQASEGEMLVVNCMLHVPYMQRSQDSVLAFLREMRNRYAPKILTFVEDESTPTMSTFTGQILEILHYYCATFDALKKGSSSAVSDCTKVEHMFFAPQIRCALSSVKTRLYATIPNRALIGARWSDLATAAKFKAMPVSSYNLYQSKMLLELFQDGYYLKQDQNRMIIGWNSKPMVAFSSWRLCEVRLHDEANLRVC